MKYTLMLMMFVLASCNVKIKNFTKYSKAPLLELEEMPSKEEIKKIMPRVLMITQPSTNEDAQKANAPSLIAKDLAIVLQEDKFANVIERDHSHAAKQEIKISEFVHVFFFGRHWRKDSR